MKKKKIVQFLGFMLLRVCLYTVLAILLLNVAASQIKRIARRRLPRDAADPDCAAAER